MSPESTLRYLVGVDGGGTKTRARVVLASGEVLGFGEAGPSALGQGVDQAWRNVLQAIESAFAAAGINQWTAAECAAGFGLSGAIVEGLRLEFLQAARAFERRALANDAFTALLGAHAGGPGAIIIAGTGSIGEALSADGRHITIGGWGYPLDDESSGAWLGMQAMRHAQKALEGRVPATGLTAAVQSVAGRTRDALLAWCKDAGQNAYASLAPFVFDLEASDARAAELLGAAVEAINDTAMALDPSGELPLVVAGSIGQRLKSRLAATVRARLVEPAGDAADGALHLIRERLRREISLDER